MLVPGGSGLYSFVLFFRRWAFFYAHVLIGYRLFLCPWEREGQGEGVRQGISFESFGNTHFGTKREGFPKTVLRNSSWKDGTCRHLWGTLPLQGKSRPCPKAGDRRRTAGKRTGRHPPLVDISFLGNHHHRKGTSNQYQWRIFQNTFWI